jgi:hypothetical protein
LRVAYTTRREQYYFIVNSINDRRVNRATLPPVSHFRSTSNCGHRADHRDAIYAFCNSCIIPYMSDTV